MKKLLMAFTLSLLVTGIKAQDITPKYEAFGKVDKEDLELKECGFEKDANAEVLFDKGVVERGFLERHVRIKIFNTAGFIYSNIRIVFVGYDKLGGVAGLKAQTINNDNG